jgi:hypothetical protein
MKGEGETAVVVVLCIAREYRITRRRGESGEVLKPP